MCLLAIQYRLVPEAPVLVAANREEYYDRPSTVPSIQSGKPRILCGMDERAGGTWLGVNQHGLFVGVANRRRLSPPMAPLSRGVLCREMLRCDSARGAVDTALEELSSGMYDGANFICADAESGWAIHGTDDIEVVPLDEGLNIIGNRDLNDTSDERVAVKFLAVASKVFARSPAPAGRPSMVMRGKERGTVSSTLIALGTKPRDAIYQFAPGAPDKSKYEDFSPLLRDILSRGLREARTREANT